MTTNGLDKLTDLVNRPTWTSALFTVEELEARLALYKIIVYHLLDVLK